MKGTGELVLLGTGISYTGNTTISSGTLQLYDAFNFSNGSNLANSISIASGAMMQVYTDGSNNAGNSNNQIIGTHTGAGTTISGAGTFQKTGTGTLGASGNNNGFLVMSLSPGALIDLEAGTLQNGGWQGITWTSNSASMNIASGAKLDVWDGHAVQIDALTGAGSVTSGNGNTIGLTVGISNGSGTYTGSMNDVTLTKTGTGVETLSGAGITYAGLTTVSAGTLVLQNVTGQRWPGGITLNNSNLTINTSSGTTVQFNGGTLQGSGTVTVSGSGSVLWGANGSAWNVSLGTGSVIDVKSGLLRNEYSEGIWTNNKAGLTVESGGTFNTWDSPATIVDALNGAGTIDKGQNNSNPLTIGIANGSGTFSGIIENSTGNNTIIKAGIGAPDFFGQQHLHGWHVDRGRNIASGRLAATRARSASAGLSNSGTFIVNRSDGALNFANAISGTGNVVYTGSGYVDPSGANTYTGITTLTGGAGLYSLNVSSGTDTTALGASPTSFVANQLTINNGVLASYNSAQNGGAAIVIGANRGIYISGGTATFRNAYGSEITVNSVISGIRRHW